MSKGTRTVYVTDQTWERYRTLYGKPSTGAANALESWLGARRAALALLKGKFTAAELSGLVDSLNGTAWPEKSMQSQPQMLAAQMSDADQYDNLSAKWVYDAAVLDAKINGLHPLECFFLIEEIAAFWERTSSAGGSSLEEFINSLV